jgi:protein-tyrosine-phosphatase
LGITNDRSNLINQEELAKYNLVLVMEAGHKEAILSEFPPMSDRVYLLSEVATGISYDIPDPSKSEGEESIEVAAEIGDLIRRGFQNICRLASQIEVKHS